MRKSAYFALTALYLLGISCASKPYQARVVEDFIWNSPRGPIRRAVHHRFLTFQK